MPFVKLDQIKKLLPKGVATALAKEGEFKPIEEMASTIVTDRSGRTVPAVEVADKDWVVPVMAWIIKKLTTGITSESNTDQYISQVEKDYKAAMEALEYHKETPAITTNNFSKTGSIEGEISW